MKTGTDQTSPNNATEPAKDNTGLGLDLDVNVIPVSSAAQPPDSIDMQSDVDRVAIA
ncbi:hypothetical protein IMZ48_44770 [Candidatus Bathyarchaeota archaeon]|nr:hypothetical protein [Candidatus Bathyarchaeota archaeon]